MSSYIYQNRRPYGVQVLLLVAATATLVTLALFRASELSSSSFTSVHPSSSSDKAYKLRAQSASSSFAEANHSLSVIHLPKSPRGLRSSLLQPPEKIILSWNSFSENYFVGAPSDQGVYSQSCGPGYRCRVTQNRDYLGTDAVFFFWPSLLRMRYDLPDSSKRRSSQKYVFLSPESAAFYPVHAAGDLDEFFNWTMTYRTDSDIVYPYGQIIDRSDKAEISAYRPTKKPRLVAQFVSNCHTPSKREDVTRKLAAIIPVDVYGACGNLSCSPGDDAECRRMLERDYYFYLAFENSVCKDYVTEKLFKHLRMNIVPIVLVRKIAEAVAPRSSFIAVDDYETLADLAAHLMYLSTNLTAYGAFFEWKRSLVAEHIIWHFETAPCPLCKALYNDALMARQSVSSIYDWWTVKSACA